MSQDENITLHFDASGSGHVWSFKTNDITVWSHAAVEGPWPSGMRRFIATLTGYVTIYVEATSWPECAKAVKQLREEEGLSPLGKISTRLEVLKVDADSPPQTMWERLAELESLTDHEFPDGFLGTILNQLVAICTDGIPRPGLFLDETELVPQIEARWTFPDDVNVLERQVASLTFGEVESDFYIFDRATDEIVFEATLSTGSPHLPLQVKPLLSKATKAN